MAGIAVLAGGESSLSMRCGGAGETWPLEPLRLKKPGREKNPWKIPFLLVTPLKINGWNISSWRFGSDHFPIRSSSRVWCSTTKLFWGKPSPSTLTGQGTAGIAQTFVCRTRFSVGTAEGRRLATELGRWVWLWVDFGGVGFCWEIWSGRNLQELFSFCWMASGNFFFLEGDIMWNIPNIKLFEGWWIEKRSGALHIPRKWDMHPIVNLEHPYSLAKKFARFWGLSGEIQLHELELLNFQNVNG